MSVVDFDISLSDFCSCQTLTERFLGFHKLFGEHPKTLVFGTNNLFKQIFSIHVWFQNTKNLVIFQLIFGVMFQPKSFPKIFGFLTLQTVSADVTFQVVAAQGNGNVQQLRSAVMRASRLGIDQDTMDMARHKLQVLGTEENLLEFFLRKMMGETVRREQDPPWLFV